jgi:ATP-dependent DNA helicase RecG
MAPTEILAQQHMRTALRLLPGVRPVLLTGAAGIRERRELLAALGRGDGELAIGTHALFSGDVRFRRLGLVVVDEQHRFGVGERAALAAKGTCPDLLVMTATPIPRSLALTVFGDLDLSLVAERPPGRRTARTRVVATTRRDEVYAFLAARLARGEQAFVVTPRVEADPLSELAAATARAREIAAHPLLGRYSIGLVHGRLDARAKEAAMADFRRGATRLLVATTVVEVGVDVSTVTIIVIEHPERFGLSQLHQLRGRVGRGEQAAVAILLVDPALEPDARARLEAFASTDDGFAVAELDLAARGPGALCGEAQHGFGAFRVASLVGDRDLIARARAAAEELLAADSTLAAHPALARAVARHGALARGVADVALTG